MRDAQNIRDVEALGIDWMGFIFWEKTKRNVTEKPDYLPTKCKRVGVFVDASIDFISQKVEEFDLDIVQLHGKETPAFCKDIREYFRRTRNVQIVHESTSLIKEPLIIKAFSLKDTEDASIRTAHYDGFCDYFLFDTPTPNAGGSGKQFDWSLLDSYKGKTRFILSGGIGPDSIEAIKAFSHPMWAGIDVNSRFEIQPALKDVTKLKEFLQVLK